MQNVTHEEFLQLRLLSSSQASGEPLPEVLRQAHISLAMESHITFNQNTKPALTNLSSTQLYKLDSAMV